MNRHRRYIAETVQAKRPLALVARRMVELRGVGWRVGGVQLVRGGAADGEMTRGLAG